MTSELADSSLTLFLDEFYKHLPDGLGERAPLKSRDIGEISWLAERCDDCRSEALRIWRRHADVWKCQTPEFLKVRGYYGPAGYGYGAMPGDGYYGATPDGYYNVVPGYNIAPGYSGYVNPNPQWGADYRP